MGDLTHILGMGKVPRGIRTQNESKLYIVSKYQNIMYQKSSIHINNE